MLLTVARMPHICGSARHATDGRVDGEAVKAKAAAVVVSIERVSSECVMWSQRRARRGIRQVLCTALLCGLCPTTFLAERVFAKRFLVRQLSKRRGAL